MSLWIALPLILGAFMAGCAYGMRSVRKALEAMFEEEEER